MADLFGRLLKDLQLSIKRSEPLPTWRDVLRLVRENVKQNPVYTPLQEMPLFDQLVQYEDYYKELEKNAQQEALIERTEALKGEKEAEAQQQKVCLEDLDDYFESTKNNGDFHCLTKWQDFYRGTMLKAGKEPLIAKCVDCGVNIVKKFLDFQDKMKVKYYQDKIFLMNFCDIAKNCSFEEFQEKLVDGLQQQQESDGPKMPQFSSIKSFYEEMQGLMKVEREKEESKKRHAQYDAFKNALKHNYVPPAYLSLTTTGVTHTSKWQDVLPVVRDFPEYKDIGEEAAYKVFKRYIEKLKERHERDVKHSRDHHMSSRSHDKEREYNREERSSTSKRSLHNIDMTASSFNQLSQSSSLMSTSSKGTSASDVPFLRPTTTSSCVSKIEYGVPDFYYDDEPVTKKPKSSE